MESNPSTREPSRGSPGSVGNEIAQRVATATGREVRHLPPLYNTVDPDALEAVVDSVDASTTPLSVAFEYASQQVTVNADGTVRVGTDG